MTTVKSPANVATIPESFLGTIQKKKGDYSHYVNIAVSLTKDEDTRVWGELVSSNPDLKVSDLVRLAIRHLHACVVKKS